MVSSGRVASTHIQPVCRVDRLTKKASAVCVLTVSQLKPWPLSLSHSLGLIHFASISVLLTVWEWVNVCRTSSIDIRQSNEWHGCPDVLVSALFIRFFFFFFLLHVLSGRSSSYVVDVDALIMVMIMNILYVFRGYFNNKLTHWRSLPLDYKKFGARPCDGCCFYCFFFPHLSSSLLSSCLLFSSLGRSLLRDSFRIDNDSIFFLSPSLHTFWLLLLLLFTCHFLVGLFCSFFVAMRCCCYYCCIVFFDETLQRLMCWTFLCARFSLSFFFFSLLCFV